MEVFWEIVNLRLEYSQPAIRIPGSIKQGFPRVVMNSQLPTNDVFASARKLCTFRSRMESAKFATFTSSRFRNLHKGRVLSLNFENSRKLGYGAILALKDYFDMVFTLACRWGVVGQHR